jgi:membrane dipeptidase
MNWIDGHIDLAYIALQGRNIRIRCTNPDEECISIPDLIDSPIKTFFGTMYTSPQNKVCGYGDHTDREAAFQAGVKQLSIYQELEADGLIRVQHQGCELQNALSMLLLMEGADPIRNPDDVQWWREQGLRVVGLTWSVGTRYAGGNSSLGPLTDEGIELIAALDEAGIAHDVSHLSDEAFDGVMKYAKGTIIASHSNSRAVLGNDSQRHLRDDQAKEIFSRGGVIGLNLCTQFLSKDFSKENTDATIEDCVEHVLHYCELAGNCNQVALGSDFDGGFSTKYLPIGLKHPRDVLHLEHALKTAGFDDEALASCSSGAWIRLFH